MIRKEQGFTLVELMITMVIFVFVIAAASQVFVALLNQFKQQSKIAETNIEGIIGLEIMRRDVEHAGYGLPWVIPATVAYDEAADAQADDFNDCNGAAPCNPPRAIVSGDDMAYASPNNVFDNSDYLVIKAVSVAADEVSKKWTYLPFSGVKTIWTPSSENVNIPNDSVKVIVISPGTTDANAKTLVVGGGAFFTTYGSTGSFIPASEDLPPNIVYGVALDTTASLRLPFNRADYYIWRASTSTATDQVSDRCAPNTGVLRKTVIAHADGDRIPLPLLDCVADLQIAYGLDTNADGIMDLPTDDISALSATQIREQLKQVRVYILAHEGQRDNNYTFSGFSDTDNDGNPNPPFIRVGESDGAGALEVGNDFDLSTVTPGNTDYLRYRWKLYTIAVAPTNLR